MKKYIGALAFSVLMVTGASANTVNLAPAGSTGTAGSGSVPTNTITDPGFTLVADTGVVNMTPGTGSSVTAAGEEMVYRTSAGTLDFFVQVTNNQANGSDNLDEVSLFNFAGFTTSVGYVTGFGGTVAPSNANRTATGSTINFFFFDPTGQHNTLGTMSPYGLGSTTYWLEVDTNATSYTTGSVGVQDGTNAAMMAYAPAVPEPMSMGLLGGGLAALGLLKLRKAKKA
jgi:hypothetical protein